MKDSFELDSFEGDIFVKENTEKLKFHYVYCNNEISDRPIIFECDAFDILEADELYEKEIGIKPERQNHIGCSVIKL